MKDMEAHLEKLQRDAAECAIIRDLRRIPAAISNLRHRDI